MKKIFPVVLVSVMVACVCCKKSSKTETTPVDNSNNIADQIMMHATIEGKEWKTDSAFAYRIKNSGNDSGRVDVMISATNKNDNPQTTVTLYVTNFTGQNVYAIDPPLVAATYYIGSKRYLATSGEIIFKNDTGKTLRGTFNFKADSIDVTNGTFTVAMP